MIHVLFFASLRERVNRDQWEVAAEPGDTVTSVRDRIADQLPAFAEVLHQGRVLAAVNENLARDHTPVSDRDTVAFFPPVTGG